MYIYQLAEFKGESMSLLSKVTSGTEIKPLITVIYGPNGVGKTTLATSAEKSIILDLEDGSGFISGVDRLSPTNLPDLRTLKSAVAEVISSNKYKNMVIDSLESLESLVHKDICLSEKVSSIEAIPYGKGYMMARESFESFMKLLQEAKKSGLSSTLIAHSQVKTFTDPNGNVQYDRYIMRLNDKAAGVVKDLADCVYFLTFKVDTVSQKGKDKVKAFGGDERALFTQWRPAHDGKSRYPVDYEINFTLDNIQEVLEKLTPKCATDLYKIAVHLLSQIKDEKLKATAGPAIESVKDDSAKLQAYISRLEARMVGQ
jgi:hypothetical protein